MRHLFFSLLLKGVDSQLYNLFDKFHTRKEIFIYV